MKTKLTLTGSIILALLVSSCKKEPQKDEGKPTVTFAGKAMDRVLSPKTYVDPGATATDDVDGDLTSKIVAHNSIDYSHPNITYDIYYSVKDAAGNEGSTGQRLVMLISLNTPLGGSAGPTTWGETPDFFVGDSLRFNQFGGFVGGHVTANLPTDSTLVIPTQTVTCGDSPQIPRTFSGTGTLSYMRSGPSIRTTITINYTQVANGVTTTGVMTYGN